MKVVRLVTFAWNAVDVGAAELTSRDCNSGFLEDFAGRGGFDCVIGRLDVPTRQQPAVEAAVMDDEETFAIGSDHETGGRNMAGSELFAGEGGRGPLKEHENQLYALRAGAIGRIGEGLDEGTDRGRIDHTNRKPPG
jgi:hypothetical protein